MSLLNRFSKTFTTPPLTLRMIVVPEGVKVGLYRAGKVASYSDVMATRGLPDPLIRFFQTSGKPQEHIYHLVWPEAKELHDAIKAAPSDGLILEANDVEELTRIERPANFRIHWVYNAAQKRLERQLINADLHLGKGWFSEGKYIWPLHRNVPEWAGLWLSKPFIPAEQLYRFVSELIPFAEGARWPVTCDLHIEQNVSLRLEMIRLLDRSMDVQLLSSEPDILETLDYLDGDSENMIGGASLLPGLRSVISEQLLQIAHARLPVRITGSDLPAFIQDELRGRAVALGVDMRQIDERYPIVDANTLRLTWRITHEVMDGIGQYVATPYLADILLQTLASKAQTGERFMAANKGWIELTPAFHEKLAEWKAQGIERFKISPQEMLGLSSIRMQMSGLRLPEIVMPQESTTLEHIARFIEILRRQGLPGGFSGLQNDANALLVGACQRLLRDNPKAKILWILAQRRRPSLVEALKQAQVKYENTEELQNTLLPANQIEGQVMLTSPGARVEIAKVWTLIIFEDLDLLAFSDAQVYYYYQLERQWSLGTFSRSNWTDDRRRAQQALHALQLAPENLATFRDQYVRALPEESRTLLTKLTSPLKKAIIGDTVPTPVPPVVREPPTIRGDTPVHDRTQAETPAQGTSPIRAWAIPPKDTFVTQARRYADRVEPPVDPVPFNQPWPTYEVMTAEQQKWYFYWRSQARKGNFLPTDTGYLFLNAYEVVNLIGFGTAQEAFDYFVNLWRHYRTAVPKLDRYFVDWLADFTAVYTVSTKALDWYNLALGEEAKCGSFDLCIEAWVQSNTQVDRLPVDYLYQLAGYSPIKNKFYQGHNQDGHLDIANKKGIQAVDQLLRESDGKSLFETFRPAPPRPITREPFAGAFYEQNREPITIALASPWSFQDGTALGRRLASIIKYTENIMRRQAKFKSQLQGVDLPPEWSMAIDKAFAAPAAPRRALTIDMSSVDVLKRDTDEIRKRLIVEEEVEQTEADQKEAEQAKAAAVPPTAEPAAVTTTSNGHDNGTLTDLASVSAIVGDTQSTRTRLLRVLRAHQWQADQATLNSAMLPGQFLNVELDYLNESAVEKLGDSLIFEENGLYVVAEDYRDEIEYILDHTKPLNAVANNLEAPSADGMVIQPTAMNDLDEDWARFVLQMKPQHWDALAALLGNVDVESRLEAIARGASTTASHLVDDINAFALDSIGDIVIATDREPPYIEDEDMMELQALSTWARSNMLLGS